MNQGTENTPPRRLALRRIIWGAFVLPWQHRGAVARAVGLPLLAVIGCTLAWDLASLHSIDAARWTLNLIYVIATSWLAVAVHRLVLLDDEQSSPRAIFSNLRRLGMFVAALISAWVVLSGLKLIIASGVLNIFLAGYVPAGAKRPELPFSFEWVLAFASAMSFWLLARFSLLLPTIAVDGKPDLINAWRASRKNGWRLAILVGALPWLFDRVADLLYRDGATLVESGLLMVMSGLFTVVEVVALSLAYWELNAPAPPPIDPPA